MKKSGFRRSNVGNARQSDSSGFAESIAGRAPFSQAQLLYLMKAEFARARRHGYSLSCILIQIDRLQTLSDIHGVELKGKLCEALAQLLGDVTRGHDHIGTASDNRFLLALPHTDAAQAKSVAERICRHFADLEVKTAAGVLPLSLSLGVVASDDQATMFFDTIVAQAEVALEWSIRDGGGKVSCFDKDRYLGPDGGVTAP